MLNAQDKARLLWHCRRGMLELDLILQKFVEDHLDYLSAEEVRAFDNLLSCTDPELYAWFMGYEEPATIELQKIVQLIRNQYPN
ncbi:MAG: hypothetical protein BGO90_05620 [Legionella sp. 40-6]|nr:succinate dehydrogenase assembly factor 2 [Legionella sp.]OJY39327.1 MAG: hypothetical protein BGO90_05620 [Legionella sp. 40-6]